MLKYCTFALGLVAFVILSGLTSLQAGTYSGSGEAHFEGDSSLHSFSGTVPIKPFLAKMDISSDGESAWIEAGAEVDVLKMDTANNGRDKKMRKMFDSANWPVIKGRIPRVSVLLEDLNRSVLTVLNSKSNDNSDKTAPKLELSMKGRAIELPLKIWGLKENGDGSFSCRMAVDISLNAFGLEPPSVLGVIRVADEVRVKCDIFLKPVIQSSEAE